MKKETFLTTFNAINENFKSIFADLSDGFGELLLDNAEDPFQGGLTIKAQPHGKSLQRLEAMSGGEKSLTALAFIFSIQRHRPAPFYVFDEIDMFLDGANAERVAHMIKNLSANAQFIVVSLRKADDRVREPDHRHRHAGEQHLQLYRGEAPWKLKYRSQPKEESIEILLEMARNGEIDPWNIDIIDITDKFLKRISDPDLRASGRTLLYASILLRMKSDILVNAPPPEEEFYDEPYEVNQEDYPLLEPRLRNVAARPVTLQELINELQRAVATKDLAHMRKSIKLERPPRKTLEEVLSLAHNEDIERSILDMTAIAGYRVRLPGLRHVQRADKGSRRPTGSSTFIYHCCSWPRGSISR